MRRQPLFLLVLFLFCSISWSSCSYSRQSTLEPVIGDSLWIKDVEDFFYKNQYPYSDEVTPKKRFIALGFDDFRSSDFSLIIPLLNKYGAKAEFNRIHYSTSVTDDEMALVNIAIMFPSMIA